MKKSFTVEVFYTFKGNFTIEADSKEQALQIQERDTSVMLGQISAANESVKDWDFNPHPTRTALKCKEAPKTCSIVAPSNVEGILCGIKYLEYSATRATLHNQDGTKTVAKLKKCQKELLDRTGQESVDLFSLVEQLRNQAIS